MVFQAGREKTGGRKSGTPNKSSKELRQAIFEALEERGGKEYLKQLPDNLFVSLLSKALPKNISDDDNNEQLTITIQGYTSPSENKP